MTLLTPLNNEKSAHAETSAMRHPTSRPAPPSLIPILLKRTIIRPALLLLLLLFSSFSVLAYDCTVDGICYNLNTTDKTASVTKDGNRSYSGSLVIPETIAYNGATYSVTSIGDDAFLGCEFVTSVTIGNSVTSIGGSAFRGCKLTSVTIGNSVTSIDDYAFMGCKLTSVTIPNSIASIGREAFRNCSGLTSVTIPESVTTISDMAFLYCSGLTSATISNSVTSIGSSAFYGCSGLTSVTIPNSVTSISSSAFSGCSGLTSVTIGNSVTSIGSYAFSGCSGLTKLASWAIEPPLCGNSAFDEVDKTTCQLIVPQESINKYKTADQWKEFMNIYGFSGVDDVSVDTPDALYEVYNLQGVRVGSGMHEAEVTADTLPHGVYILVSPQGRKKLKI